MISQKVERPFVAHRFFQINLFRILYNFEFFHCVNTTDHIRWIIPSRVRLKFCQNFVHILMKVTRFGLCLFIQSLFIKFQSIRDTDSSRSNNFSWDYKNYNSQIMSHWMKDLHLHNVTTIQLFKTTNQDIFVSLLLGNFKSNVENDTSTVSQDYVILPDIFLECNHCLLIKQTNDMC